MKILLTTTSFQDTPGAHHDLLEETGYEIDRLRGPVKEDVLLPIIAQYDAVICGDDEYTEKVIQIGKKGKLKAISKYGVGLDKIDLKAAKSLDVPVFNTPGVNQITVAEHVLALLFTFMKNVHKEHIITREGKWQRLIGNELYGKSVGILGLGRIGKELAKRLTCFGVKVFAYDVAFDDDFTTKYNVQQCSSVEDLVSNIDILSLNTPLFDETFEIINQEILELTNAPLIIVNTSRALLVEQNALLTGLKNGTIKAYLTDVMDEEPMNENHPLKDLENVIITPHIGSRTYESVVRQGSMSISNLVNHFNVKS